MATPSISWSETTPAGTANRSEGDDRIRELKTQLREVIAVDHEMDSSGTGDTWGYHNKVTFIEQSTSPTAIANTFMLFAKESDSKTELFMDSYDTSNAEMQLTKDGQFIGGFQYEVRMFSGLTANIPTGWVICDGTNSTPNLADKFVRSTGDTITTRAWTSGSGEFGAGGSDTITEIISHVHTISIDSGGLHSHSLHYYAGGGTSKAVARSDGAQAELTEVVWQGGSHTHTGSAAVPSGGVASIDNAPAYEELLFIMKS